jgi:CRISPR-associated protein Csm5
MPLKQLNNYKVNLHILSPIHIGTGEELDPFSFIIRDNQLCLIDLGRWMEEYPEKDSLYTMMDSGDFAKLRTFIAESFDLESAINCSIPIDSSKLLETYKRAIQEKDPRNQVLVSPITRNEATMEAYIPGSSIKGAIRTAIANRFVQSAGVTSKDAGRGKYNEKIFGRIKSDPLRWLKLKDVSLAKFGTVIVEAREYSMNPYKGITPKGHVEVAGSLCQTGQPVVYPLHFSMASFELHGKTVDLSFLVNLLYQFYAPKYEEEYSKFYQSERASEIQQAIIPMNKAIAAMKTNEALIRIGHFSHVECVTLDKVRNPRTRKGKNGKPLPWGTTRTLANGVYPFGWAKLEFVDLESRTRPRKEWRFSSV